MAIDESYPLGNGRLGKSEEYAAVWLAVLVLTMLDSDFEGCFASITQL